MIVFGFQFSVFGQRAGGADFFGWENLRHVTALRKPPFDLIKMKKPSSVR
jgi:hypothetical protein